MIIYLVTENYYQKAYKNKHVQMKKWLDDKVFKLNIF